ncbi:RNA polymerase subunit sigma-24 [Rhodoferax koreense]|uniref:RNA polymerase subunit sigma-24 n=1 Tax=Rhodoferax koreensis TaxID=1842727 RepID=A0A1P8K3Y7_9BURK|nr:RNA polymerase sigma-70 factor [Rhodoferax koreense]APW40720.1 RNA polymerase subunit sigma-24 [Rhodoferax koreense]
MTDATPIFNRHRPRLQAIAYRMLGSLAEAEDVVQDVWLRWHEAPQATIANAEAWLVTITTRVAIDRLRAAKVQREHYAGIWLPEPVLTPSPATPEQTKELADDVSVAFLVMLERLAPEARAAFLLREVFDADYSEVALTLGKTEAACRQIVHRAKTQLRAPHPSPAVPSDTQRQLMRGFAEALSRGDFAALNGMLAEDAALIGDGGGKVTSFPKPMVGGRRIAQLFYAAHRRFGDRQRIAPALINGQWALLRFIDGALESAQSYETDGARILRILVQRNPDKLVRLEAALHGG